MVNKKTDNKKQNHFQEQVYTILDTISNHWVYRYLPNFVIPYAQLARWERPIGWQLLMWPCWWSLFIAAFIVVGQGVPLSSLILLVLWYLFLFFLGAFVMRGAGCTYNDLIDHKLDAKVERTKKRPLPSGKISRKKAKYFILAQLFVALIIVLQFNYVSIILAIMSLFIVALYPFMKRFTYWPQVILGCAFNWGSLLGWTVLLPELSVIPLYLYIGSIFWTIGYDTIYAHQDKEDDLSIGIKSTALLFGQYTPLALAICYGIFFSCFFIAFYVAELPFIAFAALFFVACHLFWQIFSLDIDDPENCLTLFRSNSKIGLMLSFGLILSLFYRSFFYPSL